MRDKNINEQLVKKSSKKHIEKHIITNKIIKV